MKPQITFDKNSAKFIIEALSLEIDEEGFIKYGQVMDKHLYVKCGICKKKINIKHFAGVVKDIGFVCDNIVCLCAIASQITRN